MAKVRSDTWMTTAEVACYVIAGLAAAIAVNMFYGWPLALIPLIICGFAVALALKAEPQ